MSTDRKSTPFPPELVNRDPRQQVIDMLLEQNARMATIICRLEDQPQSSPPSKADLATAHREGWHANFLEREKQKHDPSHPITYTNPYSEENQ